MVLGCKIDLLRPGSFSLQRKADRYVVRRQLAKKQASSIPQH